MHIAPLPLEEFYDSQSLCLQKCSQTCYCVDYCIDMLLYYLGEHKQEHYVKLCPSCSASRSVSRIATPAVSRRPSLTPSPEVRAFVCSVLIILIDYRFYYIFLFCKDQVTFYNDTTVRSGAQLALGAFLFGAQFPHKVN